ncbi:MAG: hypothetical protein SPL89_07035 [Clostridia bacterium]|nr:hypothetical protein [Clostridia bacterium]
MKLKKLASAILALCIAVTCVSVFAGSSDLTDENYYTTIFSDDFETRSESAPTGDSGGYVKESNGNMAWYADKSANNTVRWRIDSDKNTFANAGEKGEFTVSAKAKFSQNSDRVGSLIMQTQLGNYQMGLEVEKLNVKPGNSNSIQFKLPGACGGNVNLGSLTLNANTWYTFRLTFNLNEEYSVVSISNPSAKVFEEKVDLSDKNLDFSQGYIGSWDCVMIYISGIPSANDKTYLDDIKVAKTTAVPVTVNFDDTLGSVSLGETALESGAETPVAYGSDAVLAIAPKGANTIKDVKVDGVSVGNDASVTLSQVYSAKTVSVEFEKGEEAPEGATGVIDFAIDMGTDTNIKTFDTAYANGVTNFDFYDNGVTGGLIVFKSGTGAAPLSEYFKIYADGVYNFTSDKGTVTEGETTAKLSRTEGWHNVKIKSYTDSYNLYFDGVLVKTVKTETNGGVKYINAQTKGGDGKVTEGTSRKLWYKTLETAPLYKVSVTATEGGTASVDKAFVESGETAVLTVSPETNHTATVKVNGSEIPLSGNTLDIANITADTSVEVTFTKSAPVVPGVSKTSIIANADYNGNTSAVVYAKITGTATGAGIILKDEKENELVLNAFSKDETALTSGDFGIRVFGAAMVSGSTYKYAPFVTYNDGTDDITVKSEEESFVFGK